MRRKSRVSNDMTAGPHNNFNDSDIAVCGGLFFLFWRSVKYFEIKFDVVNKYTGLVTIVNCSYVYVPPR